MCIRGEDKIGFLFDVSRSELRFRFGFWYLVVVGDEVFCKGCFCIWFGK